MITELEFKSLAAQGYNRIPLIAEAFADLETPLSLYLKLAGGARHSFLLESVVGGERFGRYSFIGLPARTLVRTRGFVTEVVTDGRVVESHDGNPLAFIAAYQARFKVALRPGLPRFCGGLAGYFGYDAVRYIEPRLARTWKSGGIDTPDILLLQTEEVAVIDNLSGRLYLIVWADPAAAESYFNGKRRLSELTDKLRYSVTAPPVKRGPSYAVEREFDKADYLAAVLRSKDYIAAGDMMQVQIGQRLKKRYTESPLTLYRALRSLNPSPYMYFYDMGDFQIVGASPEILVRHEHTPEGDKVTIRPLAGTRPRGTTPERDKALEEELRADPKERAEHLMLIDLARNDIGRIAKTGSVKVTEAFAIERYSHVMHIVSNVEGLLQDGISSLDVLRATFPAGTLSGAPKIRAMEIIDELEPVKRGIYGGACGYLSYAGDMDLAIAIRTGIVKDNTLYVQAAAGVVADSVPEMEWKETEAKARALIRAAELVEEGSDLLEEAMGAGSGKAASLLIVPTPDRPLKPEQRKFNQLLGKIEQARAQLQAWQDALPHFAQAHARRVRPLLDQLYDAHLQAVRLIDGHLAGKGWSRKQRHTLRELVCGMAARLIDDERSDEARVQQLKALHDRHAEVDFDTESREALAGMKDLFETFAGVDLGDHDFESEEALMRHAHEKLRAQAEQDASALPPARKRKPSAAQLRREQEDAQAHLSVREVYRQLVGALHPDRASDDADRAWRTALMQRVNQANEAKDILALFALQLEIEQVDAAHVARATAERARHYNRLLTGQLSQLQAEVQACQARLCMEYGLDPYRRFQPGKLGPLIDDEVRVLRLAVADAERDVRKLSDPGAVKPWLAIMARQLAREADFDDSDLPF